MDVAYALTALKSESDMLVATPHSEAFPAPVNRDLVRADAIPVPLESSEAASSPAPVLTRQRARSQSVPPVKIDRFHSSEPDP